jgi:hypothetical protein
MKPQPFLLVCIFMIIVSFLIISCDKQRAKRLSGNYNCTVDYTYWDITPQHIDSTYTETVEVKAEGDILDVLGYKIPVDSVTDEQVFITTGHHFYLNVQFKNDSLYFKTTSSGLGGGATYVYRGKRE